MSDLAAAHVTIGPMTVADVDDVAAIEAASFARGLPPPPGVRSGAEQLEEELARPWSKLWVARDAAGHALAFALAWHVVDELHLLNLATHPAERRRGIAWRLLEHLLGFAKDHHVANIFLEVRRANAPAIALYRRAGFTALALRSAYYPDGEDAVEMRLALDRESGAIVPGKDEVILGEGAPDRAKAEAE